MGVQTDGETGEGLGRGDGLGEGVGEGEGLGEEPFADTSASMQLMKISPCHSVLQDP
jgi:hypothetical protein